LVYLCFFAPCRFVLFFVTLASFDFAVLAALVVFGLDTTTGTARTVDAFRSVLPQTFALSSHLMPALSQSARVSGCVGVSVVAASRVVKGIEPVPQTFELSFQCIVAASHALLVSG
jgi:hypothetical protein